MAAARIELIEPRDWFGAPLTALYLRHPTAGHLSRFGEPQFWVTQKDSGYLLHKDDVIAQYIDALLSTDGETPVDGGARALMETLSLADGMQIREALMDFFGAARAAVKARRLAA